MDPFSLFRKDHDNIRELLDRIMAGAPAGRKGKWLAELQQTLHFHLDCEERFLFSRLLRLGQTRPLAEVAIAEHQQIKKGLQQLQNSSSDQEWESFFPGLRAVILDHFEEEEDGLYEEAREVFDEALLRNIAQQHRGAKQERLTIG
jgi:hemerythrin superfamily protein